MKLEARTALEGKVSSRTKGLRHGAMITIWEDGKHCIRTEREEVRGGSQFLRANEREFSF